MILWPRRGDFSAIINGLTVHGALIRSVEQIPSALCGLVSILLFGQLLLDATKR